MVPLLGALLDYDATPATYARYDAMTALELFQKCACTIPSCPLVTVTLSLSCCCSAWWQYFVDIREVLVVWFCWTIDIPCLM